MVECRRRSWLPSFASGPDALDRRVAQRQDRAIAPIRGRAPQLEFIRARLQAGHGADRDLVSRLPFERDLVGGTRPRGDDPECLEVRDQLGGSQQQRPGLPRPGHDRDQLEALLLVPKPRDGAIPGGELDEQVLVLQDHGSPRFDFPGLRGRCPENRKCDQATREHPRASPANRTSPTIGPANTDIVLGQVSARVLRSEIPAPDPF